MQVEETKEMLAICNLPLIKTEEIPSFFESNINNPPKASYNLSQQNMDRTIKRFNNGTIVVGASSLNKIFILDTQLQPIHTISLKSLTINNKTYKDHMNKCLYAVEMLLDQLFLRFDWCNYIFVYNLQN